MISNRFFSLILTYSLLIQVEKKSKEQNKDNKEKKTKNTPEDVKSALKGVVPYTWAVNRIHNLTSAHHERRG